MEGRESFFNAKTPRRKGASSALFESNSVYAPGNLCDSASWRLCVVFDVSVSIFTAALDDHAPLRRLYEIDDRADVLVVLRFLELVYRLRHVEVGLL